MLESLSVFGYNKYIGGKNEPKVEKTYSGGSGKAILHTFSRVWRLFDEFWSVMQAFAKDKTLINKTLTNITNE